MLGINRSQASLLRVCLLFTLFISLTAGSLAQNAEASGNGPLEVKTYRLSNGLTVYLNEDHSKPEIFGAVIVKAGSRNDPEDATGVAHYFEHMMFKGTDKIGTTNWEKESVLLDSISLLYDQLASQSEPGERKKLLMEINRLSLNSAEYAIPNETDVMLRDLGGDKLNAGTSFDMTTYYNTFPSFQIEKWLEIYAERFRNPVFRLFQSELEVVYEEKNLYSDVPVQGMLEDFLATHYKGHPYARPIIGYTEHLKNPRISKMMEFYKNWYVANNMALVLIGDFSAEEILPVIESKFSQWRKGDVPKLPESSLKPYVGREFKQVRLSPVRIGLTGFRSVPYGHEDSPVFYISGRLLSNGSGTGIFDKMMVENKVMAIQPISFQSYDHGSYIILFVPKIVGQSFGKAEELVNIGLDQLKNGDFSESLLEAVKLEVRKEYLRNLETMDGRYGMIMQAFINGRSWEDMLTEIQQLEAVTKEDIMRVSKQYFGNDRLVYYSKMGMPPKDKIEKPDWKPVVPKNTEAISDFARQINNMKEKKTEPRFVRFGKDVEFQQLVTGYNLYRTFNPYNDIFTMEIRFHKGKLHDPKLSLVADYLNQTGTSVKTFQEFKSALQKSGATIDFSVSDNYFSIHVEGIESSLQDVLTLVNELMTQPQTDENRMKRMLDDMKAANKMLKKDPMQIASALNEFALYGQNSSFIRKVTLKEAKKIKAQELAEAFRQVTKFSGTILYTGQKEMKELAGLLKDGLTWSEQPVNVEYIVLDRNKYLEPVVYIYNNKKARQSNIHFFVEGKILQTENDYGDISAFNEYFGSGMSSIVFQEIREFRSLGYTATANYRRPLLKNKPGYLTGYLNTQSDKTTEGIEAMSQLILDMPKKPERMAGIKKGLTFSSYTSFPDFRSMGARVANWRRMEYEMDPGEMQFAYFKNISFDQIVAFYNREIKGQPLIISVSGKMKDVDSGKLQNLGRIENVRYKQFIRE